MSAILLALLVTSMSPAADYSAQRIAVDGTEVIRLWDAASQTEVLVAPSFGNNAYEMKVKGKRVFWSPYATLAELKSKPVLMGNPLLAPWANRIGGDAYYFNGRKYLLNPSLANYRTDAHQQPIHGMLAYAPDWKVIRLNADGNSAVVTSRLEFWKRPDRMAQFPFAHAIEMTYRLRQGTLEVETQVENLAEEEMPLSLGYHPYFQVNDAPRDSWMVHVPAKNQMVLSEKLVPTGEIKPVQLPDPASLASTRLDDVFSELIRGSDGKAEFWVRGREEKVSVLFGPKYPVAVVYAPPGRDFICFEPMTGPTNAFNLAHEGKYTHLQKVPPGGTWKESFWIRPSGF